MKTILVIGAGFCGAVAVVRLLREAPPGPMRVILLNRSGLMARGVAYGTRTESHVLNVPAARMGAFAEAPEDFLAFAQRHDARITGASFVPRRLYGEYLEWLLAEAARKVPAGVSFRAMVGEASQIRMSATGGATVELDHGETIFADHVILALGNYAPAHPRVDEDQRGFYRSPSYVRDPWRADALHVVRRDRPVLLIGSGLTMLDVLLDLRARGVTAPVVAVSRHGLVPLAHRDQDHPPPALPMDELLKLGSVRACLRVLRAKAREIEAGGGDWRDVVGALRPVTPALWQGLPVKERARFLRHGRAYWEVHRHRCAPELAARMQAEIEAGSLQVLAGRLCGFEESPDAVRVMLRPRGGSERISLDAGAVINCTGPESDARTLREPLLAHLRASGHVVADEFGLGFRTTADGALLDREGQASKVLFYAGPFLKADHWEATAVPELREHVARVAKAVVKAAAEAAPISAAGLRFA